MTSLPHPIDFQNVISFPIFMMIRSPQLQHTKNFMHMANLHVLFELLTLCNVEAPKTIEISSLVKRLFDSIIF
jgi:hypothetical protein